VVVNSGWARFLEVISVILGLVLLSCPFGISAGANDTKDPGKALNSSLSSSGDVSVGNTSRVETDPDGIMVADAIRQMIAQHAGNGLLGAQLQRANQARAQLDALNQLKTQVGQDLKVHFRPGNQTVAQVRGKGLERAASGLAPERVGVATERTSQVFLQKNRALLRLDDPSVELTLVRRGSDEAGGRHLRFVQKFQGLEVWPCGLNVHLGANGDVNVLDGAYVPTPNAVGLHPGITAAEAQDRAKGSVPNGREGATKDVTLVIYAPLHEPPRLAWKLGLDINFANAWVIIVDAEDGRVLNRITQCLDANVPGSSLDLFAQTRALNVWSANNQFYLVDTSKPMYNATFDPLANPLGVISVFDLQEATEDQVGTAPLFFITSVDANAWLSAGVSASYNLGITYDYYLERHNRNSIDGNGGNIRAVVRVGQMNNAFWSHNQNAIFLGDVSPYAGATDVIGHELTHGVTAATADLIYQNQSGALNEAMSDIFGVMAEARINNGQADWTEGEQLGQVHRNLKNPGSVNYFGQPAPSKMSQYINMENSLGGDYGGVHGNSTIISHAYYLLAEGLPGGVGIPDAEKIFYRCLTQHLQRQSEFIDARLGCVASAEELFGVNSVQAKKVGEAFDAVEIFATPPTPAPSPIPTVEGPDSTLFVSCDPISATKILGRREAAKGDPAGGTPYVQSIKQSRPAVSGDGSFALFVDAANDICGVRTDDISTLKCLGLQGLVHAIALSPDSRFFAFVLGVTNSATGQVQPTNEINVADLVLNTNRTYKLFAPAVDGSPVDNVLYADAMVFTTDSKALLYDAVTQLKFGDGTTAQGSSMFRFDIATETFSSLRSSTRSANYGNPNVSRIGNRYVTFDGQDTGTGQGSIFVMDLFTGDIGVVGSTGVNVVGNPCFTGDDAAVIYAVPDGNAPKTRFSLVRQSLSANRLQAVGQPTLWLQDATIGVIYRRGTFTPTNALPSIAITAPADHSVFQAPATINISADANDADNSVTRVEYYEGANYLGQALIRPYNFNWQNVPPGSYRLIARAIDKLGASTDSAVVNVTVNGTNAPLTVSITAPADNAVFQAPVDISFTAATSDENSVVLMEYYDGATYLGQAVVKPYNFTWTNAAPGVHHFFARALTKGATAVDSAPINVTVNGTSPTLTVGIIAPANNSVFQAPGDIQFLAQTSDDNSVVKVEYYAGANYLGQAIVKPYSFTWTNVPAGSYQLVARAIDKSGGAHDSAAVNVTVNGVNPGLTVRITAPTDNDVFQAPADIPFTAETSNDNSVVKVQYYAGANFLGQSVIKPYNFTWQNVPAGAYSLTARAVDKAGGTTDSAAVNVTVTGGVPVDKPSLSVIPVNNTTVRVTINGPAGNYIIEQSNDLINWADIYPVTVGANGVGSVDDSGGPTHYSSLFYRARKE
jgi:Zn-dependent metalloprotease